MSFYVSLQLGDFRSDAGIFTVDSMKSNNDPLGSIRDILHRSLYSNIEQSERKLLLENLRSIQNAFETTDLKIENPEEVIRFVKKNYTCLEKNKSYAKKLWERKEVELIEGVLIFSDLLKIILNDKSFESLMQAMPEEYQEQVIDCCFDGLSLQEKSVKTLLKYCPNITTEILKKIAGAWKESDIAELWRLFKGVSLKERSSIVTWYFKCVEKQGSTSTTFREKIVQTIVRISPQDRGNVLKWAIQCFYEGISEDETLKIIEIIASIDPEDRENVIDWSFKCVYTNVFGYEKARIIKAVSSIPIEDRKNSIEWSLQCFYEGILVPEKARIIKAISSIPPQDRKNVLKWVLEYFHDGIFGYGKPMIIKTISSIPVEDRKDVIGWASKCFEDIIGYNKIQIIKAISSIPARDRKSVTKCALRCFCNSFSGHDKGEIIKTIALIPFEDRENVIEWSIKCFHNDNTDYEKIKIITAISIVPKEERFFIDNLLLRVVSRRCINKKIILNIYLLSAIVKTEEAISNLLRDIYAYDQDVLDSLEQKLFDETYPQEILVSLAQYAQEEYSQVVSNKHSLMQRIIELQENR